MSGISLAEVGVLLALLAALFFGVLGGIVAVVFRMRLIARRNPKK